METLKAENWILDEDNRRILWYSEPLKAYDIFAGGFLIIFGCVFLFLYAIVAYIMLKNDKDIIGFRFLFSASIADMLLLFNYAIWPGITILAKSEIIQPWMRSWVQIYLDWAWFSMCYHYMIIAWSRFAAIRFANAFRMQSRALSYSMCVACYVCALIQVLVTHFQKWYVTFYYEPSAYGMLSENFAKYLNNGHSLFFFTYHLLMMVIPIFLYGCALGLLLNHRKTGLFNGSRYGLKSSANTETRLLIPCIINSFVFIIGQVVITMGTGEGKWATWMVLLLFSANSAANPILLITFSIIIRQKALQLITPFKIRSANYTNVKIRTPSPNPGKLRTEYHIQYLRQLTTQNIA